jgi:NTE family protein
VEIEGVPYWDGGYTSNPPILPFLQARDTDDVLLVQIKPVYRPDIPTSSQDITARISEIGFYAALYAELRALAHLSEQARSAAGETAGPGIRMHRLALPLDQRLSPGSALDTDYRFLEMLRQAGRRAAQSFLQTHFDDIGERATLDVGMQAKRELQPEAV